MGEGDDQQSKQLTEDEYLRFERFEDAAEEGRQARGFPVVDGPLPRDLMRHVQTYHQDNGQERTVKYCPRVCTEGFLERGKLCRNSSYRTGPPVVRHRQLSAMLRVQEDISTTLHRPVRKTYTTEFTMNTIGPRKYSRSSCRQKEKQQQT